MGDGKDWGASWKRLGWSRGTTTVKPVNQSPRVQQRGGCPGIVRALRPAQALRVLSCGPLTLPMFRWEAVLLLSQHRGPNHLQVPPPFAFAGTHGPEQAALGARPQTPPEQKQVGRSDNRAVFCGWPPYACAPCPLLEMAELSPLFSKFPHSCRGARLGGQA